MQYIQLTNPRVLLILSQTLMGYSSIPSNRDVSPLKSRFARGFLRALVQICSSNPSASLPSSSLNREFALRRYHRVKLAAYASMASAVGRRRVWSRAMLQRIRRRSSVRRSKDSKSARKTRGFGKKRNEICRGVAVVRDVKKLQKLVPGGESVVGLESLLQETAHYIKCLATQVQVMRSIADLYSCP